MPAEPLVDLASLDLDRVVADHAEVLSKLKQRGRFELLDAIVHLGEEEHLIVGYKDLRPDAWWAPDHIPGRPLFPGALMIEAAAQLATYDFAVRRPDMADTFVGFAGVDRVRFRGTVEPPARFVLAGRAKRIRATMFTYATQGFVEGKLVFEGDVTGMVV